MKKVAILQSNYIPWKGYFDLINMVDEFVLFDCVQYTNRDWRNRNKIKTANGTLWLTIPVKHKSRHQTIDETEISDVSWSRKHWQSISQAYIKAPFFKYYKHVFEEHYLKCNSLNLSSINFEFITLISSILGITTSITKSSDYILLDGQTEKLIGICEQAGADVYLSGPAAKDYFDMSVAKKAMIDVEWMDYSEYPEYHQLHGPFEHGVSILDLIFNEGPNAVNYMKSFKV